MGSLSVKIEDKKRTSLTIKKKTNREWAYGN